MERYIYALLAVLSGYLSGSVNYAIIVTKAVTGKDIRALGNHNPGTSNVIRQLGWGWGLVVGFLDAVKGVGPILFFHLLVYREQSNFNFAVLYLIGIFAVLGHCKSFFLKFKGGGGINTMAAVSLYFLPIEFTAALLLGGGMVLLFTKKDKFRIGQKVPIFFVFLTPFISLATYFLLDIPLFWHFSIGNQLPATVAGAFALSLMLLAINSTFLKTKVRET